MKNLNLILMLFLFVNFLNQETLLSQELNQNKSIGVGIRGNGESVVAHWPGLARLTEGYGPFQYMAGGSSATITIFLYESVLLNPHLSCSAEELETNKNCLNEKISYMIKLWEGLIELVEGSEEVVSFKNVMSKLSYLENESWRFSDVSKISLVELNELVQSLKITLNTINNPVIKSAPNWELFNALFLAVDEFIKKPSQENQVKVKNLAGHVYGAVEVFGKFNARDDEALFVRPGLVNFKSMGFIFSRWANFLSLRGVEKDHLYHEKFKGFLSACALNTTSKNWDEIKLNINAHTKRSCFDDLGELFYEYQLIFSEKEEQGLVNSRELDLPGESVQKTELSQNFTPIISTSIITEKSEISKWKKAFQNFMLGKNLDQWRWLPDFNNIKFAYWTKSSSVTNLRNKLKSYCQSGYEVNACRSLVLGNHPWSTILSLSPAEPGLSRGQQIEEVLPKIYWSKFKDQLNWLSLGGWSDLMPQMVLKGAGSDFQILMTRRGYQTYFGQGVVIRLGVDDLTHEELFQLQKGNLKPDGETSLDYEKLEIVKKRTSGVWALAHNLHNPDSSFNKALLRAHAIYCTDWDRGDITVDYKLLMKDSYYSPLYLNLNGNLGSENLVLNSPQASGFTTVDFSLGADSHEEKINTKGKSFVIEWKQDQIGSENKNLQSWFNRGCTGIKTYQEELPVKHSPYFLNP
jgi:hypothetical protein